MIGLMTDKNDLEMLRNAFNEIDEDKNGYIDRREL